MKLFRNDAAVIPALITPFDNKGEIYYPALKRLIDRVIGEGADGIYACGSTSEVFLLSREERKELLEAVMEYVNGRVPVIAHVGSTSQREACMLAEHAASCGAKAVSAVPPFYFKYAVDEIATYYYAIADASGLPVILYNIPIFTGVSLNAMNAGKLLQDPRILGIKHSDYNLWQLEQIRALCPDKLIMNGHEQCMLGALMMGADGGIGTTFNCLGPLAYQLRDSYQKGDYETAKMAQAQMNRYIDDIARSGGSNKAVKYMLQLQGIDCGTCREPFAPLTEEVKRMLEKDVESMAFLK